MCFHRIEVSIVLTSSVNCRCGLLAKLALHSLSILAAWGPAQLAQTSYSTSARKLVCSWILIDLNWYELYWTVQHCRSCTALKISVARWQTSRPQETGLYSALLTIIFTQIQWCRLVCYREGRGLAGCGTSCADFNYCPQKFKRRKW